MSSVDSGEWRDIPRGGRPQGQGSCAGTHTQALHTFRGQRMPTGRSEPGHLPSTASLVGGVWGVSPPCCHPNHKHRVGCPHALLGSQRPSRAPTPVHEEPQPLEASLPACSSPAPLCRRTLRALAPPESGFQQLGIFHRQQQWGQLMSKVAPFPTRLSPSAPSPAVRCARQRHSGGLFGPAHLLLTAEPSGLAGAEGTQFCLSAEERPGLGKLLDIRSVVAQVLI